MPRKQIIDIETLPEDLTIILISSVAFTGTPNAFLT
jgi:hypothetical protein